MNETRPIGQKLCAIARFSIVEGARSGAPSPPPTSADPALAPHRATFVTLRLDGALRGCIGSLQPIRPLAEDVHMNAFAAGFRDPRFTPLTTAESTRVRLSVSVLGEMTPLAFTDEGGLLAALVPGEDGLLIRAGDCQATFLPSVWQQLSEPDDFLRALKKKAGLASSTGAYEALRYRCDHFHD